VGVISGTGVPASVGTLTGVIRGPDVLVFT